MPAESKPVAIVIDQSSSVPLRHVSVSAQPRWITTVRWCISPLAGNAARTAALERAVARRLRISELVCYPDVAGWSYTRARGQRQALFIFLPVSIR